MKSVLLDKLKQIGYEGENSDELFAELPKNIWVTVTDKNMKRKEAFFSLIFKKGKAIFSLSVQDDGGELFIIHEETDSLPVNAIARMIIFITAHKMAESNA